MELERKLRHCLEGHLSGANTETGITIASIIVREFAVSFAEFIKDNCIETPKGWQINGREYLSWELLKIYEDEK